ncbi:hypothetical protein ACLO_0731 [Arcobacter cloacae]|nr:hypothetical protein ACLO_0731 [Arcobacter cloacae]
MYLLHLFPFIIYLNYKYATISKISKDIPSLLVKTVKMKSNLKKDNAHIVAF